MKHPDIEVGFGSACDQKPLPTTDTPARLVERGEFVYSGGQFHISYEHGEKVSKLDDFNQL